MRAGYRAANCEAWITASWCSRQQRRCEIASCLSAPPRTDRCSPTNVQWPARDHPSEPQGRPAGPVHCSVWLCIGPIRRIFCSIRSAFLKQLVVKAIGNKPNRSANDSADDDRTKILTGLNTITIPLVASAALPVSGRAEIRAAGRCACYGRSSLEPRSRGEHSHPSCACRKRGEHR